MSQAGICFCPISLPNIYAPLCCPNGNHVLDYQTTKPIEKRVHSRAEDAIGFRKVRIIQSGFSFSVSEGTRDCLQS